MVISTLFFACLFSFIAFVILGLCSMGLLLVAGVKDSLLGVFVTYVGLVFSVTLAKLSFLGTIGVGFLWILIHFGIIGGATAAPAPAPQAVEQVK